MSDPVHELIAAVTGLEKAAQDNATALDAQARSTRRHRGWIAATVIGLMFDLMLSGLFWWQHEQQVCRNERAGQFFVAEQAKVRGQVQGLLTLRNAGANRQQALLGFTEFEHASEHYLQAIKRIQGHC